MYIFHRDYDTVEFKAVSRKELEALMARRPPLTQDNTDPYNSGVRRKPNFDSVTAESLEDTQPVEIWFYPQ